MEIEFHPLPAPTIEEFAEKHELVMQILERQHGEYYANFKNSEVLNGSMLSSIYGTGFTQSAAMQDYAKLIAGKLLVVNAYTPRRQELRVPYFSPSPSVTSSA